MLGRNVLGTGTGYPILLTFDGRPELKAAGVTLAWETVTALAADLVTPEGYTVPKGGKWLRYGQVITKITTASSQVILVTGTPTGGTFTLGVMDPTTGLISTVTLNYNSSVAATQAAFDAVFGSGNTTVSGSGALPANAQTVTFGGILAGVVPPPFTLATNALTGGSTPTVSVAPDVQTITVTVTPTGGNTVLTYTNPITGVAGTLTLPYNATAASAQTLFDTAFGAGNTIVTGGALPGTALTVGFIGALRGYAVPAFTTADAYTGGSSPASAITATAAPGGGAGKFGPYDPAATDGRQTLTIGQCFLLNESIVKAGVGGIVTSPIALNTEQVGGALYGGRVWKDRIIATSSTHTLAAGPTWTELFAAFPRLFPVEN